MLGLCQHFPSYTFGMEGTNGTLNYLVEVILILNLEILSVKTT